MTLPEVPESWRAIFWHLSNSPESAYLVIAVLVSVCLLVLLRQATSIPLEVLFAAGLMALIIFTTVMVSVLRDGFVYSGPFWNLVSARGTPTADCEVDPEGHGSAVQRFETGWMVVLPDGEFLAISQRDDGSLLWKSRDPIEGEVECDEVPAEARDLLKYGFRKWYCTDPTLASHLGDPRAEEGQLWVQFQQFSKGLLVVGLPWGTSWRERGPFRRLFAAFLDAPTRLSETGTGRWERLDRKRVPDADCSAVWYPAVSNWLVSPMLLARECEEIVKPRELRSRRVCSQS